MGIEVVVESSRADSRVAPLAKKLRMYIAFIRENVDIGLDSPWTYTRQYEHTPTFIPSKLLISYLDYRNPFRSILGSSSTHFKVHPLLTRLIRRAVSPSNSDHVLLLLVNARPSVRPSVPGHPSCCLPLFAYLLLTKIYVLSFRFCFFLIYRNDITVIIIFFVITRSRKRQNL